MMKPRIALIPMLACLALGTVACDDKKDAKAEKADADKKADKDKKAAKAASKDADKKHADSKEADEKDGKGGGW